MQCKLRALSADGSRRRLQARLLRHGRDREEAVRTLRQHLEKADTYVTTEDEIEPLLGAVGQPTLDVPTILKVG